MPVLNLTLLCPSCGAPHVDKPEPETAEKKAWDNPPHRKHLCHTCGNLWTPSLDFTNGVENVGAWTAGLYDLKSIAGLLQEINQQAYDNAMPDANGLVKIWLAALLNGLELAGAAGLYSKKARQAELAKSELSGKHLGNSFIALVRLLDVLGYLDDEQGPPQLQRILMEAVERYRLTVKMSKEQPGPITHGPPN